jgi:HEAT repeat protein
MWMILAFIVLFQGDPGREVERLRSDSIEEREEAEKALKELGPKAIPALERAAGDVDPEVAQRVRTLLSAIRIRETLTPAFRKAIPGLENRLARSDGSWTEVLNEIRPRLAVPPYDGLGTADWMPLITGAARVARRQEEILEVLNFAQGAGVRTPPEEVAGFLKHGDPKVLVQALTLLARSSRVSDASAILPLLKHPEPQVRERAVNALGGIRASGTGGGVLACLKDAAPVVRRAAALAAGAMNLPGSADAVAELRSDAESNVRAAVPLALGQLGGREAGAWIASMLKDADGEVRANAIKALGMLGVEEEMARAVWLLHDSQESVRAAAAEVMGDWGIREALPDLVHLLEDSNDPVSESAWNAVVALGAAESGPRLRPLLKSESVRTRRSAARALGGLGVRGALPDLREFLKSAPEIGAGDAAAALALLGDQESLPAIRGLLRPLDDRAELFMALAILQDGEMKIKLRVMSGASGDARAYAANALAQMGDRDILPVLRKLAGDRDSTARNYAVWGLGALNATADAPLVQAALEDEESYNRSAALQMLGLMGTRENIPAMERLLSDPEVEVRIDAARYLAALGSRAGLPTLFGRNRMPAELNALRQPRLWGHLRQVRVRGTFSGSAAEVLRRVSSLASIPLSFPPTPGEVETAWQSRFVWVPEYGGEMTAMDVLQQVVGGPYDFILEPESIRIVSRKDARAFWRAWWAEEEKNTK